MKIIMSFQMSSLPSKETTFKVMVAGDGAVGKSSLIRAKTEGKFEIGSKMTIGIDFRLLTVHFPGYQVHLQLWDLGGQERFQFIHDVYIKGAKAAFILYDLSRAKSFESIRKWFDLIYSIEPDIPVMLIGTKKDLVSNAELIHFAHQWKRLEAEIVKNNCFIGHFHISSKIFDNVEEVFQKMIHYLINRQNLSPEAQTIEQNCIIT
jgi:small GTP-binding protein